MTPQIVATWISDLAPCDRSNGPRRAFGLPRLCVLAILVAACSEAPQEPPLPAFTVTDSAGVRMVVNSGQQWGEGEGWQVTAEPVVTLGVRDYPVEQQFERLGEATRLSDGTIVILELRNMELRAFDASGTLLWTAGGIGDGPGETRPYPDTRGVLTRLPGDTLQLQNGQDRVRYTPAGDVHEHRKVDYARFRRWGRIFLQYCPFEPYFLQDQIVVCHTVMPDPRPDIFTREQTIMRTTWNLEGLDTLGAFFETAWTVDDNRWRTPIRSPLGLKGIYRVTGRPRPTLLFARNDNYRIEFWDIAAGSLTMVVERQTSRRARTAEEADFRVKWSVPAGLGADRSGRDPHDDRWSALDSLSIAEGFLLDELGYLWVRRGPSPTEGDEGMLREITTPDGEEWAIRVSSGLHDVFRPDGVYLGTVKLPTDLMITEIGADYILGIVRDEVDIQYVWMYGLDRREGGPE